MLLWIDLILQNFHENLRYTNFLTQYHPETVFPVYWDMGYVLRGKKEEKYWEREGKLPFESCPIIRVRFLKY